MLSNEMGKVNWSTWYKSGTKKKSESPTGMEPMNSWIPGRRSIHKLQELMEVI